MPRTGWTPSIVAKGDDRALLLVDDAPEVLDFGSQARLDLAVRWSLRRRGLVRLAAHVV